MDKTTLLGRQRAFINLASIVDLGGSGTVGDIMRNVIKKDYICRTPDDFNPVDSGDEDIWRNSLRQNLRRPFMKDILVERPRRNFYQITEKGESYLSEQCDIVIELFEDYESHIIGEGAYIRAKEIKNRNEQDLGQIVRQIERELFEDYTEIRGGSQEEADKEIPEYMPEYRRVVDGLKEKYENVCQIDGCSFTFRKRNGGLYSEGHHLIWRAAGGGPEGSNIAILCPNLQRGMILRTIRYLLLGIFLAIVTVGCSHVQESNDVLFQTSTINALLEGVYDGEITYQELAQHGDFGIGTFNALDGEMIALDGKFHQIKADGVAYSVDSSMKTPFAMVTSFEPDRTMTLDKAVDYEQLEQYLDSLLPTKNIFYAIRITGEFEYIKTRSVPVQKKPYPKLVEVAKNQPTFEFSNVEGTMVGFRCPVYVEGINVPGYHIHFITNDRKSGGHLLECRMRDVKIEIDNTSAFYMVLPETGGFHEVNLSEDKQAELEKVEK